MAPERENPVARVERRLADPDYAAGYRLRSWEGTRALVEGLLDQIGPTDALRLIADYCADKADAPDDPTVAPAVRWKSERAARTLTALADELTYDLAPDGRPACPDCGRERDPRAARCKACANRRKDGTFTPETGAAVRRAVRDTDAAVREQVYAELRASLDEPPPADDPGQAILARQLARRLGVI